MLWDTHPLEIVHALEGHTDVTWGIAFSPDSKLVASGSGTAPEAGEDGSGEIKLWDVSTGRILRKIETDVLTHCELSPDGRWVVGATFQNGVNMWRVDAPAIPGFEDGAVKAVEAALQ